METKEFIFKGMTVNGFLMLILNILITLASIAAIVLSITYENLWFIYGIIGIILSFFIWCGFIMLEQLSSGTIREPSSALATTGLIL